MVSQKIKVWLIRMSEAFPTDKNGKLQRTGLLAEYLAKAGYDVTWWASTFIHGEKCHRFKEQKSVHVNDSERIIMLHSDKTYKKNVSLARVWYYKRLAREFRKNCEKYSVPDIIICSYPAIELAREAERYGRKHNVPVILDVRDLWPDIFISVFPEIVQPFVNVFLQLMKRNTEKVFYKAHGITGVVPASLEWGLHKAHRKKRKTDRVIYIGVKKVKYEIAVLQEEYSKWERVGVTKDNFILCFISTLGSHIDLYTVIEAVNRISKDFPKIQLVVCGDGDDRKNLEKAAGNNVVFAGWANDLQMQSLMKISSVGIYALTNKDFFAETMSNKMIQYMSEGLPILTSLHGLSKRYIEKYNMGYAYQEGNVKDCERQIRKLIALDGKSLSEMRKNSLNRFLHDFEYKVVGKQFEECIMANLTRKKA